MLAGRGSSSSVVAAARKITRGLSGRPFYYRTAAIPAAKLFFRATTSPCPFVLYERRRHRGTFGYASAPWKRYAPLPPRSGDEYTRCRAPSATGKTFIPCARTQSILMHFGRARNEDRWTPCNVRNIDTLPECSPRVALLSCLYAGRLINTCLWLRWRVQSWKRGKCGVWICSELKVS